MWTPYWGIFEYGVYHPQLITCPVPEAHRKDVPRAVSLQSHGNCTEVEQIPSNVLRVDVPKPKSRPSKRSIGVCMIALKFATFDISSRLVEYLEWIRLMGVEKVHMYVLSINDNMKRVLKHYEKLVRISGATESPILTREVMSMDYGYIPT